MTCEPRRTVITPPVTTRTIVSPQVTKQTRALIGQGPAGPAGAIGPPGPAGATGPQGASAYQVAVQNGFVGTEEEWLDSLRAVSGPNPEFSYVGGELSRIDYSDGNYTEFTYQASRLQYIDKFVGTSHERKSLFYNPDGTLSHITSEDIE